MKPLFLLLVACLLAPTVHAQYDAYDDSEDGAHLNGFGGPLFHEATLDGDWRGNLGAGGALLINGRYYVGVYGMAMLGKVDRTLIDTRPTPIDTVELGIGFNQGGLWTGVFINPRSRLQVTVNAMLGVGSLRASAIDRSDRIYLAKPYIGLQYALAEFMRVELAAGYRIIIKDNDLEIFRDTNLSAPMLGLHIRFGGFD